MSKPKETYLATTPIILGVLSLLAFDPVAGVMDARADGDEHPIAMAYRVASGLVSEYTIEARIRVIRTGVDFIGPNLVATRDGVPKATVDKARATSSLSTQEGRISCERV